jgi:hypothetical protein
VREVAVQTEARSGATGDLTGEGETGATAVLF